MDPKLVTPILVAVLVAWGIARRVRRTFGRQPVHVGRIAFRIGMLALVAGLVVATARDAQALESVIAGVGCGAALGYVGLTHTRFEVTPEGRFYIPHTYIGLAVTALFLGRLIYRFAYLQSDPHAMMGAHQDLAIAYQKNPVTLGIFGLVVGYYVVFYVGVLAKTRTAAAMHRDGTAPGG